MSLLLSEISRTQRVAALCVEVRRLHDRAKECDAKAAQSWLRKRMYQREATRCRRIAGMMTMWSVK